MQGGQDQGELGDPNLTNPQNKQGYGKSIGNQIHKPNTPNKKGKGKKEVIPIGTMSEQSVQAVLQMGVLVIR
jgi:hypothetical protein